MRIYADFNGIEPCSPAADDLCLDLTGYGTLASLSLHGIRLASGQELTFADADGLTVRARVYFDATRISSSRSGWYASFKKHELRQAAPVDHDFAVHLCAICRKNLKAHLEKVGQNFRETCPFCGTPVMFPLLPPDA